MRKLLLALTLLLPGVALAQTPGQYFSGAMSNTEGGGVTVSGMRLYFEPCQSGNSLWIGYTFAAGTGVTSVSITDYANTTSKADTVTFGVTQPGNTDANQVVQLAVIKSCSAGVNNAVLTFTGGTPSFVGSTVFQAYNTGSTSAFGHNTNTGTSATCSSIGASGDLLINYVVQDSITLATPGGFTAGTGMSFAPMSVDLVSGAQTMMQWRVETAATNPGATLSSSGVWNSVCGTLTAASAGVAPSGMQVRGIYTINWDASQATSWDVPTPTVGNLEVASYTSGADDLLAAGTSGISDNNSATWGTVCNQSGQGITGSTGYPYEQMYFAQNTTPSLGRQTTIVRSNNLDGDTIALYDIQGAATSSVCDATTPSGSTNEVNQSSAGTLTMASTLTPGSANGISIGTVGVFTNTVGQNYPISSPAGAIFDCSVQGTLTQDSRVCQNNGMAHFYTSSGSAQTWTWAEAGEAMAYGTTSGIQAHFAAPSAGVSSVTVDKVRKLETIDP